MPWYVVLACESQQLELLWETALLHLDIRVIQAALGLFLGIAITASLSILLLELQDIGVLIRDRHELLAVIKGFCVARFVDRLLVGIINFGVRFLNGNFSCVLFVTFFGKLAVFL